MEDITKKPQVGLYDVIMNPRGDAFIESGAADGNANAPRATITNPGEVVFSGGTSTGTNAIVRNVYQASPTPTGTSYVPIGTSSGPTPTQTITSNVFVKPSSVDPEPVVPATTVINEDPVVPVNTVVTSGDTVVTSGDEVVTTTFDPDSEGYDKKTGLNKEGLNREQVKAKLEEERLKALGTDERLIAPFSWEAKGKTAAELQYDADALKAEQNALASRREFMAAAEEGQTLKDTQKYLDAQSAEKAGWTGGYRLDQNRQRQYLEASIQASMYNSQEMARFGYETSLDAARIAYEQGKEALALEYYKVELDKATAEAQLTGVYFSPEQKDMIFQYKTADQIFSNPASSKEEKDKAGKVINTLKDWFSASGLSQDGIKTLAKIDSDRQDRLMKQSMLASAIETVPDGAYPLKDSKGNYLFGEDGVSLQYFLPNVASNQEKYNYFSGNYTVNGQVVESGKGVYRTELNKLHSNTITTWFNSLSNADKALSSAELETRLREYVTTYNINPLHTFTQGIVSDNGDPLDFETILKGDPNYKSNEYAAKHSIGGKEFNVIYNLKTGAVRVGPAGGAIGDDRPGIDVSTFNIIDANGSPVQSINPSDTYEKFVVSNTVPLMIGSTRITNRAGLNRSGLDARLVDGRLATKASDVTSQGYTKLFTETFDSGTYDYYGKAFEGSMKLVRFKTK